MSQYEDNRSLLDRLRDHRVNLEEDLLSSAVPDPQGILQQELMATQELLMMIIKRLRAAQ